jgi:hypothetical protein
VVVLEFASGFPSGFAPSEGDIFRPVLTCMATDGSSVWLESGPEMDAAAVRIETMLADPGTYRMSIQALDPFFNNVAMRLPVTVP